MKAKLRYQGGDGQRALEAARAEPTQAFDLGYYVARTGETHGHPTAANAAKARWDSEVGRESNHVSDGAAAWLDAEGKLNVRLVVDGRVVE